jgi:hypothetical protein
MRLKIESDGTREGTRVYDAADGALLGRVQALSLHVAQSKTIMMGTITVAQQEFVVEGDFCGADRLITAFLDRARAKLYPCSEDTEKTLKALRTILAAEFIAQQDAATKPAT